MMGIWQALQHVFQPARRATRSNRHADAVKLQMEELGERIVPSIVFGQYSSGTWAFDSSTGFWRFLTPNQANAITEGADGVLFGSYVTYSVEGTWSYNYWTGSWTRLTSWTASALSAATDNSLFGSFYTGGFYETGTWEYSPQGAWTQLTGRNAIHLTAVRDQYFYGTYVEGADGTWQYRNGAWNLISTQRANALSATPTGTLFASFPAESVSYGTWRYNGSWWDQYYTSATASMLAAVNDNFFYGQYGYYTYSYNGGWAWIGPPAVVTGNAVAMTTAHSAQLFISYQDNGTWRYDGSWTQYDYDTTYELA
jgi:hypothetical protein